MHLMLQTEQPRDYVIASGTSHSLGEFAAAGFAHGDLLAQERLEMETSLMRPSDLSNSSLDPRKIERDLNWRAGHGLGAIVSKMYGEVLQ
jgi:GDPmannose 4,6-dehydratase